MAMKRMFSSRILNSSDFYLLPASTQMLYVHICQNADDEGVNNQIELEMFKAHATAADLDMLILKRFLLPLGTSSVQLVKHWYMHNAVRKDRFTLSSYHDKIAERFCIKENGSYTEKSKYMETGCQLVAVEQNRIEQNRLDKISVTTTIGESGFSTDFSTGFSTDFSTGSEKSIKNLLSEAEYKRLEEYCIPGTLDEIIKDIDQQGIQNIEKPFGYVLGAARRRGIIRYENFDK